MPRIKFGLNNDDDCIRAEEDYADYANIVPGVKTNYLEQNPKTWRKPNEWKPINLQPRYPNSIADQNSLVRVYPDPNYNPTIEEMIPYAKVRNTPDTYIVMADDPVREFLNKKEYSVKNFFNYAKNFLQLLWTVFPNVITKLQLQNGLQFLLKRLQKRLLKQLLK